MALFEIKNLSFTYPKKKNTAILDINLKIYEGDFVTICGKSGCGKSTLIRQLKSSIMPYGKKTGKVLYKGQEIESLEDEAFEIGYVSQSPENQIVTDKVWHEMAFGLENMGLDLLTMQIRVAEMASYFGIENWFDKDVSKLSGGQKQILNLASIMVMQPKVLILDEPTASLDPIAAGEFLQTIKRINLEFGTTIIIVEQRLNEVFALCDKIVVMEDGKVIAYDTPRNISSHLENNDILISFPAPIRIYNELGGKEECPVTIKEGRKWLSCVALQNKQKTEEKDEPLAQPIIEAKDVWFRYNRQDKDILKGLNLKINEGEICAILGGNGTGKSTLLSLLGGLRTPYRGKISLYNKDIKKLQQDKNLGILPQDTQTLFVKDTVKQDLLDSIQENSNFNKLIKETQIENLLDCHPYDLSKGEQQRVALCKVLLFDPKIILLDEPTKGMDGFYKKQLGEIFKSLVKEGKTIVMVSHDVEFCACFANRCSMLFDGKIVTTKRAKDFFLNNSFYTTDANRMARDIIKNAVTVEDVVKLCQIKEI